MLYFEILTMRMSLLDSVRSVRCARFAEVWSKLDLFYWI